LGDLRFWGTFDCCARRENGASWEAQANEVFGSLLGRQLNSVDFSEFTEVITIQSRQDNRARYA
jgi:hypothetical protein